MRRRSEKGAGKKAKTSPEKKEKDKPEKLRRTRSRRRKQSSSSDNESAEETVPTEISIVSEPLPEIIQAVTKEESPEQTQEQVWHVKAADTTSDSGEIKKLKICLTRPPSTPERVDRSPRSKRKHSRATSSSDTPSVDDDEKKKPKYRTRKSTAEMLESADKNVEGQGDEMETESEVQPTKSSSEISQSTEAQESKECILDETPMSTTNDEVKEEVVSKDNNEEGMNAGIDEKQVQDQTSDADTTVASPKPDQEEAVISETKSPEGKRSPSLERSEVLELHAEEIRCESSELKEPQEDDSNNPGIMQKDAETSQNSSKVSINEAENEVSEQKESPSEVLTSDSKNDVVENSYEEKLESSKKVEIKIDNSETNTVSSKEEIKMEVEAAKPTEDVTNGQSAPLVINRKRRWGSRPVKLQSQKSITISTDVLKEIIPDVKPTEFEEVIEERKHKRIEVTEKIERPVLPKIIIDNTDNVNHKKDVDEKDKENVRSCDTQIGSSRKISIVKENDSIIAKPPSPPRHQQSNILYITNLVRPFTLPQLKNLLQRTGRIIENGFWIDKIKSKCFVIYENEEQAVETRHALHGVTWPVSNPKSLQVDFSTQEDFDKAKANEDKNNAQASTIPGTVEDWLREQDMKREKGETDRPWERKAAMREWDLGKNEKIKEKEKHPREERPIDKRRHRSPERSPEPARKFKKKEEEAPAKLLDDLFRKTKTTPCIYWLPLSAETIAIKEEQRRQHMAEYERRMHESRRPPRRH
ncbi:apoptotic chromatin condensation inducer in the nucleus-like [Pieris brassicae]|uniref:apoptotic chromatin condensation inducer in the nucleus-like n=2 Tax=Pieris brassicae TaxID=7116 RepID=UPI001E661F1C|nr:apoptotic chromatin condensation inducer in the nucleus-like [Pieris brassicae]XP_045519792.1 apoptotic chromatin condensation inducer in the nucleus-like [Pieris brassicae]